jgi:hypothetical protein
MLSATPSRQPGEDFRRKVASHWGISYAQLEALALGEQPPASSSQPVAGRTDAMPSNLAGAVTEYVWTHELPDELRVIVREQARQHYVFTHHDFTRDEWQRILTGLEREALAFIAHRETMTTSDDEPPRASRKRRARS